jgi:predicted transcriptional regulator
VFEGVDLGNYRRRIDIIADILLAVGQGATRTRVMYHANLSYKLLVKYLVHVTVAELVRFEKGHKRYVVTSKGEEFLQKYKEYERRNRRFEERLNHLTNQKKSLEKMISGSKINKGKAVSKSPRRIDRARVLVSEV